MDTRLIHGDCCEWIPKLPKHSVDFVFADPPFGSIKEGRLKHIDKVIPLDRMWECFRHVLKPSGTVIVFGTQPFISQVICSNTKEFRYDLIWRKLQSGFLNCNNRPIREHQTIAVFSERAPVWNPRKRSKEKAASKRDRQDGVYNGLPKPNKVHTSVLWEPIPFVPVRKGQVMADEGAPVFNPQFKNGRADPNGIYGKYTPGKESTVIPGRKQVLDYENDGSRYYPTSVLDAPVFNPQLEPGKPYIVKRKNTDASNCYQGHRCKLTINVGNRHPSSVLTFKQASSKNVHPFEKPLPLCEWIIKTYTNEGMTVLDPTMGGGTSGVACRLLGRKFIGVEKDQQWFIVARDRIYSTPKPEAEQPEESIFEKFGD